MSYHRPDNLEGALDILAATGARILAGGTDIYPALNGQKLRGVVLDITAIPEISGISENGSGRRIGATTTWAEVAKADLPAGFGALQEAARVIGSRQVQNAGSVGGNLCNASPAADGVPPLLVLDADVEISAKDGVRRVALRDFITGVRQVDLQPQEIVTGLHIAKDNAAGVAAFEKFGAREYLVISISMVAVRIEMSGGLIRNAAISVGSASPVARRLERLEHAMKGREINTLESWRGDVGAELAKVLEPISDIRADADFRLQASEELVMRALSRAILVANG
ncbi:MAG: xanthine dehydrogenase family protein subunit M [Rhodobacteraceae bacterium]|nr:xanthine dehydrogenase family protein subunit M [Paracoccaceae bacterium]